MAHLKPILCLMSFVWVRGQRSGKDLPIPGSPPLPPIFSANPHPFLVPLCSLNPLHTTSTSSSLRPPCPLPTLFQDVGKGGIFPETWTGKGVWERQVTFPPYLFTLTHQCLQDSGERWGVFPWRTDVDNRRHRTETMLEQRGSPW